MSKHTRSLRKEKLQELAGIEGHETITDLLEASTSDSLCPAICMNPGCDNTAEMEPDQSEGWCDVCETNTMVSALVLAGII